MTDWKIIAYGVNLTPETISLVHKMTETVSSDDCNVLDLMAFDPVTGKDVIALIFGKKAERRLKSKEFGHRLVFPELDKLDYKNIGKVTSEIKEAMKQLESLKSILREDLEPIQSDIPKLNLNDLPPLELSILEVTRLKEQQAKQSITQWYGTTKSGKTISVSMGNGGLEREADIHITLVELFALAALKDLFEVKEIEYVTSITNHN